MVRYQIKPTVLSDGRNVYTYDVPLTVTAFETNLSNVEFASFYLAGLSRAGGTGGIGGEAVGVTKVDL